MSSRLTAFPGRHCLSCWAASRGSLAVSEGEKMELTTKRLVLRGFVASDWQDVHELAADWRNSPGPEFDKWPTTQEAAKGLAGHFSGSPGQRHRSGSAAGDR